MSPPVYNVLFQSTRDCPRSNIGSRAQKRAVLADVFRQMHNRIGIFMNLPIASLERLSLPARLHDLGRDTETPAPTA